MLYSTKEIAEMYSSKKNKISPYKVTQDWCKKGLKHTPDFKFKKEWVDEFLEEIAISEVFSKYAKIKKINCTRSSNKNNRPITMEDLEVR